MKTQSTTFQRFFFLGILLLLFTKASGQDLPSIIPPSPNAAAFHTYGNTQVNYYTGSANITIPIWEIQEGGLSVPIYLKYTGGNGIKVGEVASWVGLGWTLNTGGAISRTIRGIADEDQTLAGLFNTTIPIPSSSPNNDADFQDIGDGDRDSQSDMYMYNYPGGSGSFFFDTDENIYYKPKKNIDLDYTVGVQTDTTSVTHCSTGHAVIKDFTLKDPYGNSYLFNEKERSNTITYDATYTDNRGFPSTWFLKKIENRIKTRSIDYEYTGYSYTLKRSGANIPIGSTEDDIYTETSYISRRLKKITYSQGSIEFIASTAVRKDLSNNYYLDKIIVRDSNDEIVKTMQFNYKYMTDTALVDVTATITNADAARLVLTSVEECDGSSNCLKPTSFTYDTSEYLPSRFSKAIDHWGYYNGESSNTKLEPRQVVKWWHIGVGWDYATEGSANKTPNDTFSRAGILTEIEYPTGGTTEFEYEGHTAVDDGISGILTNESTILQEANSTNTFTIDLPSGATLQSTLKVTGFHSQCTPTIKIKEVGGSTTFMSLPPGSQGGSSTYDNEISLDAGDYEAWYTLSSCTETEPAWIKITWENEDDSDTKIIGGLRLSSVSNYSDTSVLASKKNYDYTGDDNKSSGRVLNVPKYYGLTYPFISDTIPAGYERYVNPIIPLATTQGSDVGYGKITITEDGEVLGKQEQYYATGEDYPDNDNRIDPSSGLLIQKEWDGVKIDKYPLPEKDSKDFVRGILQKQILYKKSGSTFSKVYEKEMFNDSLVYNNIGIMSFAYIKTAAETVEGLKVHNYYDGSTFTGYEATYYEIHTGYNMPSTTIETFYNSSGDIVKTTTQKYDEDTNDLIDYYMPTSVEVVGSDGITSKTESTYVFNKTSKTTAETDLESDNALYLPLESESYKNTELLGSQKTIYSISGGLNLPEKIQTLKGVYNASTNPFEDRIIYDDYDSEGNPVEVSKSKGAHILYIYGYNESLPIAKIENATGSELTTAISTLNSSYNTLAEIQGLSDADDDRTTTSSGDEGALRTALADLRAALPDAIMTSFTYDPMIGVTSVTDPRGDTVYYDYDDHNRLEFVLDKNGKILSQNQYNYKN